MLIFHKVSAFFLYSVYWCSQIEKYSTSTRIVIIIIRWMSMNLQLFRIDCMLFSFFLLNGCTFFSMHGFCYLHTVASHKHSNNTYMHECIRIHRNLSIVETLNSANLRNWERREPFFDPGTKELFPIKPSIAIGILYFFYLKRNKISIFSSIKIDESCHAYAHMNILVGKCQEDLVLGMNDVVLF